MNVPRNYLLPSLFAIIATFSVNSFSDVHIGSTFGKLSAAREDKQESEALLLVTEALIPQGQNARSVAVAEIQGLFPNDCYAFERVDVSSPQDFVHEVRLVATVREGMCLLYVTPFQRQVPLGQLEAGTHLIRFMNPDGTAIERTVDILAL